MTETALVIFCGSESALRTLVSTGMHAGFLESNEARPEVPGNAPRAYRIPEGAALRARRALEDMQAQEPRVDRWLRSAEAFAAFIAVT